MNSSTNETAYTEPSPEYDVGYYTLNNFSVHSKRSKFIYSQLFYASGLLWKLKVYPAGIKTLNGYYISVFLELFSNVPTYRKFQCSIDLCNQIKSKDYSKVFTASFKKGDCWGIKSYFPRDILEQDGFIENDSLCFRFQIRSLTNYQRASDLAMYIDKMNTYTIKSEEKKNFQTRQVREIESDCKSTHCSNDYSYTPRNSRSFCNFKDSISKIINAMDTISVPGWEIEGFNWEIKESMRTTINEINKIGTTDRLNGSQDYQGRETKELQMTIDEIDHKGMSNRSVCLDPEIKSQNNIISPLSSNTSNGIEFHCKCCQKSDQVDSKNDSISMKIDEIKAFENTKSSNDNLKELIETQNGILMSSINEKLKFVEDTFCCSESEIGSQPGECESSFWVYQPSFGREPDGRLDERETTRIFHANVDRISFDFDTEKRREDSCAKSVSVFNDRQGFEGYTEGFLEDIDSIYWISQDETTLWVE
jgi:hypothetical protein